ncbi:MAG: hypothetical protein JNK61_02050 [Bacteroidia bacterium]|nr:hypothetical protein [Bacteroidia bacterium]HQV00330.1 hypothetical protein [Bacteroidia bacterium]
MNLTQGLQYGFITQELEMVLPQLMRQFVQPPTQDSSGNIITPQVNFTAIAYQPLIALLIAGYKEHQQQIDSLADLINNNAYPLKQPLQSMTVTLSNQASIILNQNDPNPFAQNTTITYSIPDEVKNAQLLIYDNNGTILKTITINEKGQAVF